MLPHPDFAVLLLAHGGPESLDEIPNFLRHIRNGKPLSDHFIEEVVGRYQLIGGRSPLREICENLAEKLHCAMALPVYVGMRHSNPFLSETVARIKRDGHRKVIVVCLAPHYSVMSIGAYKKAFLAANESSLPVLDFQFVDDWHLSNGLIQFHANQILKVQREVGAEDWSGYHIFFTAHSLPSRILAMGDPYVEQMKATMMEIAKRITLPEGKYELVFQSASPSPEPWLGLKLEESLDMLAERKTKSALIVPIGFVSEHVEVLYDIDIAAMEQARGLGITLKRTQMPNDSEEMVAIMRGIVEESAFGITQSVIIQPTERCFA